MKLRLFAFAILIASFCETVAMADVEVYDANGQYIGTFMDSDVADNQGYIRVYVPSLKASVRLLYSGDFKTADVSLNYLYFERGGCLGTPYTSGPFKYIFKVDQTPPVFMTQDISKPKTFSPLSVKYPTGVCYDVMLAEMQYFPVAATTLPYKLPISLPIEFRQSGTRTVVIPLP